MSLKKVISILLVLPLLPQNVWASGDSVSKLMKTISKKEALDKTDKDLTLCPIPDPHDAELAIFRKIKDELSTPEMCLEQFTPSTAQQKPLENERQVCECLYETKGKDTIADDILSNSKQKKDFDTFALSIAIDIQNAKIKNIKNGTQFQATFLLGDQEGTYNLNGTEDVVMKPGKDAKDMARVGLGPMGIAGIQDYMSEIDNDHIDSKQKEEISEYVGSKVAVPTLDPKILGEENQAGKDDFRNGVCVSPKEYLAFNAIPRSNIFYEDLAKTDVFVEEDWDMVGLRKKISKAVKEKDKESVAKIGARINFLNRNPLIKNLFAANETNTNLFEHVDPKTHKEILDNKTVWSKLPGLKKKLFETIKELRPKTSCQTSNKYSCIEKIAKENNLKAFRDKMKELYITNDQTANDVYLLTNWQSKAELLNAIIKPSYMKNYELLPRSAQGINNFLHSMYGAEPSEVCKMDETTSAKKVIEPKKCYEIYSKFCSLTRMANTERIVSETEGEALDWMDDLQPDIDKNKKYEDFNARACHTKRILGDEVRERIKTTIPGLASIVDKLPKEGDFFEFAKVVCQDAKDFCLPENKDLLYARFLQVYPNSKTVDDGDIKAFSAFILDNDTLKGGLSETAVKETGRTDAVEAKRKNKKIKEEIEKQASTAKKSKDKRPFDIFDGVLEPVSEYSSPLGSYASAPSKSSHNVVNDLMDTFGLGRGNNADLNDQSSAHPFVPGPVAPYVPSASYPAQFAQAEQGLNEATKHKTDVEEDLKETKQEYKNSKDDVERRDLENRITMLERALAEKDGTVDEYKKMLKELKDQKQESSEKVAVKDKKSSLDNSSSDQEKSKNNFQSTPNGFDQDSLNNIRSQASIRDNSNFSGSSLNNAKTPVRNSKNAQAIAINDALLKKYELSYDGADTNGVILINQDKELSKKSSELLLKAQNGNNLPLKVSNEVYSGIESRSQETLNKYILAHISSNSTVTKVSVSSPGKMDLQFYAIKLEGKVVLQPIRKASLGDLKRELDGLDGQNR